MHLILNFSKTRAFIFLFCLLVISLQFVKQGYHSPHADEFEYIKVADDLIKTNIFTNGKKGQEGEYGAFFAPAYPFILSLSAQISPSAQEAVSCFAQELETCDQTALWPVVFLQIVMAAVSASFIYYTVLLLFEKPVIAWLTLILVLVDKTHVEYARHFLTENAAFFFFYLFGYFLVRASKIGTYKNWAIAAVFLALSALARPTYYYLIFLMPIIILIWECKGQNHSFSEGAKRGLTFIVVSLLISSPWMLRNYIHFGDYVISNGYASFILVQRISYNMMSWAEWGVSFIYWLPDAGDSLARYLFDEELYRKLSWYDPESYYMVGNRSFRAETLMAAGSQEMHFSYLIKEYLLGDLFKHIMVTFPIALRGMWTGKYIGLTGFLFLIPVIIHLARSQQAGRFFLYLIPGYFILGLNAFVSVNVVRYNEPLIVIFSASVSLMLYLSYRKIRNGSRVGFLQ